MLEASSTKDRAMHRSNTRFTSWQIAIFIIGTSACKVQLPTPPPERSRERLVVQREFRVGMFAFGYQWETPDQKGERVTDLRLSIPSMLLTALGGVTEPGKPQRFASYEGGRPGRREKTGRVDH